MKLELMMRVIDTSEDSKDESERLAEKVLRDLEEGTPEQVKFVYKPYTVDIRDVGTFGLDDDEHTKLVLPFGLFYAKIDYYTFRHLYEAAMSVMVKTTKDFKFVNR
jgi:hypothetical protein